MIFPVSAQAVAVIIPSIFFIILLILSIVLPGRSIVSVLFIILFLGVYFLPASMYKNIDDIETLIIFLIYPIITLILSFLYLKNKIKVKNKRKLKGMMLTKAILSIILCSSSIMLLQTYVVYMVNPDIFNSQNLLEGIEIYLSLNMLFSFIMNNEIIVLPIGIISLAIISLNKKGKARHVIKIILSCICLLTSLYSFIGTIWHIVG